MNKPILINSYPRSGSIFFAELINCARVTSTPVSSIHLPEIIGVEEVLTIIIFRNPKESITSNIFKGLIFQNIPDDLSYLDNAIKRECDIYIDYIKKSKSKNVYLVNFNKLIKDPQQEILKFLQTCNINKELNIDFDSIFEILKIRGLEEENTNLYLGHFPRNVEKNSEYIKIWEYIKDNNLLDIAYNMYEEILKEF